MFTTMPIILVVTIHLNVPTSINEYIECHNYIICGRNQETFLFYIHCSYSYCTQYLQANCRYAVLVCSSPEETTVATQE